MSAPVLTLPLSVGCYDGTTIMDANGKQVAGSEDITLAASIVAAVNESASLRAECEAVRADRDSLWTTVNRVKAERDAALAEVARLKALVIDCIPFIGYQASVEDLKARAYEAVDYDAYCKAHYATKEVQP